MELNKLVSVLYEGLARFLDPAVDVESNSPTFLRLQLECFAGEAAGLSTSGSPPSSSHSLV